MRHLKAGNRLGVTTAHRRAMMRNMVTSILENGQITCTLARAKEVRKPLEKMIGWGKQGSLHARRQALRFVKSKEAMTQLFEELAVRYKDRKGGYCRIIKLGKNRLGDNSEMAIVQLLGSKADQLSELKSQSGKKKKTKKNESSVLKEVSEKIQTENSFSEKDDESVKPKEAESNKNEDRKKKKGTSQIKQETSKEEFMTESVRTKQEVQQMPKENIKTETVTEKNIKTETDPEENIKTKTVSEEQLTADKKKESITTETDSSGTDPLEVQKDSEEMREETENSSDKVIIKKNDSETKKQN